MKKSKDSVNQSLSPIGPMVTIEETNNRERRNRNLSLMT
jgi:hypothetical protein